MPTKASESYYDTARPVETGKLQRHGRIPFRTIEMIGRIIGDVGHAVMLGYLTLVGRKMSAERGFSINVQRCSCRACQILQPMDDIPPKGTGLAPFGPCAYPFRCVFCPAVFPASRNYSQSSFMPRICS